MDDTALLQAYARTESEPAFAALVEKHLGMVYSAARRQVRDAQLAEDVTQAVFIILARKVGRLARHPGLSGWLLLTTRYAANAHIRAAIRRTQREQEACMQSTLDESDSSHHSAAEANVWTQLEPLLDEALASLGDTDRAVLALRYFENQTATDIGRTLKLNEETSQKRVNRALEKLRKFFTKRGVAISSVAIAGAISANSVQAAPVGLAKAVTAVAVVKGTAASTSTLTLIKGALKIMAWTKMKMAIVVGVGILLIAGTATVTVKEIAARRTPAWQKKFDLSLLNGLPQQVKILPSLPATVQSQLHAIDGRNGKGLALGQSVPNLLETAYQVVQSRLILNAPVPVGEYDFITTYFQAEEAMTNLQREIKKTFGLTGRPEMIETNVLILTVQSPNAAAFKPGSGKFSNQTGPGFYAIRGATLYVLVADLEASLGTAIVNETRLKGNFDIDLKWDSTPDGLKRALRDELGLELTPGRETVPFLVVDKTN